MLIDLYLQGRLDLDRFVSETIALDEVEDAFHKMERGEVLRSVVVFEQLTVGAAPFRADTVLRQGPDRSRGSPGSAIRDRSAPSGTGARARPQVDPVRCEDGHATGVVDMGEFSRGKRRRTSPAWRALAVASVLQVWSPPPAVAAARSRQLPDSHHYLHCGGGRGDLDHRPPNRDTVSGRRPAPPRPGRPPRRRRRQGSPRRRQQEDAGAADGRQ